MTITPTDKSNELKRLEHQLKGQKDHLQKLIVLDQLAAHYAFTDYRKAQPYLAELKQFLKYAPNRDFELNYHLNTAFIENQLYNYDLSRNHFLKAIDILEDQGGISQQVEVFIDYAGICINRREMEEAGDYLDRAKSLLKGFPDECLEARIICREGFLNLHYGNYSDAIEQFHEAEKMINTKESPNTIKDYYFKTLIYSGLGFIYEKNNDFEKSVRAYLNVVNWCETLGMRTRLSWHYLNVGNGYMSLNDDESAEQYFKKAINSRDDISQYSRAAAFANLGSCYFMREDYEEALRLFRKAKSLYRKISADDYRNFAEIDHRMATLFVNQGKEKKAKKYFKSAHEYATKGNDFKSLAGIYKDMATFAADLGNHETAYEYLLLHGTNTEIYQREINGTLVTEMEVKYQAEKRRQEAEMLRLQAAGLQLKALRAQMNPHFIYNALNAIQDYITSKDLTSATKYLAIFARLMRQSLEYSDMENIPLEEEVEFLENYLFINQKLRFDTRLSYKIIVDEELEEDIMGVPTMIVQPYVENALEHGLRSKKKGMVTVEFKLKDEDTVICIIEDNGIGIEKARKLKENDPASANHRSKGTSITEERLEILNKNRGGGVFVKTIDLKTKGGRAKGTRVEILIPIVIIQK